jgi:hypothetical protein
MNIDNRRYQINVPEKRLRVWLVTSEAFAVVDDEKEPTGIF